MKKSAIDIALIQMSAEENPAANLEKTLLLINQASKNGAQIVCLQELFLTRYFPQKKDAGNFRYAERFPGKSAIVLSKLARARKIAIIAPGFEKTKRGIYYNSAVVIDGDGSILGRYRKMHLPNDPGFYEKFYFAPGNLGFPVFQTRYAKIAVFICWDQWFPEPARLAALQGAQIIFYPTAIGSKISENSHVVETEKSAWQTIQRAHAIANGVYVAAANRVGIEDKLRFWGNSFVSNPFGKVIAKASGSGEKILLASCDLLVIKKTRKNWPFLKNRCANAYSKNEKKEQAKKRH